MCFISCVHDINMITDLLKLIIDPLITQKTCFLCFRLNTDLQNIHSDLIIVDNGQEFNVSVWKMISQLFPYQENILQQVCDKCLNAIINLYILIRRHNLKKQLLLKITEDLEKKVVRVKSVKKCLIKLDLNIDTNVRKDPERSSTCSTELLECEQCNMQFESKGKLRDHFKISHKNTNEAIICHICGKKSKTPNALKAHLNCHSKKQCPYCSKFLKTHSHFKIHVQNHVSTVRRSRKHTSYKCHDCNFTSFNKGSLEAHINKVHLDLRPYICPICCKGFFKKSNLTEHAGIHQKIKSETCEVCGENFVCKKTLTEHLRLHTNETPYECLICFKKFVTSGRRSDHMKRKHMEKSECCPFCCKMFSLRKELNRHVKKVHSQRNLPVGNIDSYANAVT